MVLRRSAVALLACALAASCGDREAARAEADVVAPARGGETARIRIVAANLTSGDEQRYESEGIRIFQALRPDVALVQEMRHERNDAEAIAALVTTAFGPDFHHYRETDKAIPNGIVSRFPIVEAGQWVDPVVADRGFAWAKIAIPGPHPLWAVSVHLLTSGSVKRNEEATALVAALAQVVTPGDYVTIGGDLNTSRRNEPCLETLGRFVVNEAPYPADQQGNDFTNAPRNAPYDWVLVDGALGAREIPTVLGASAFPRGLVFDSRVYAPLTEVAPVEPADSDVEKMQHMPVVRDFAVPL